MTRLSLKLNKINNLLISFFGVPAKAAVPPDPLDLLIATILSQNTNDKNSYAAFRNLKQRYNDWNKVADLSDEKLGELIKTAGLTVQKTSAIKNILRYLKEEKGIIDLGYLRSAKDEDVLNELTALKGIGIKTASCVLLFSFERNVFPVDTHVHRVLNRLGVVKTKAPEQTFYEVQAKIPEGTAHELHTNIIRLGREICKPAVPVCYLCPLKRICRYPAKDFARKVKYKENNFFLLDNVNNERPDQQ
jgi:endonuclease III